MEDELWPTLYRLVVEEYNRRHGGGGHQRSVQYNDAIILLVAMWAVLHDRPISWACGGRDGGGPGTWRSLPGGCPWASLPSRGTMSRRLKTLSLKQLLEQVFWRLLWITPTSMLKPRSLPPSTEPSSPMLRKLDSKPLPVGGFSKDRDAKRGHCCAGNLARGYKLFGCWGTGAVVPEQLLLGPMNLSDPAGAMALINRLSRGPTPGGYLLADTTHDTNPLHAYARQHNFQLLTPRKQPGTGLGHCPHDPARLRSIEMLEGPSPFGRSLYATRTDIERDFGHMGSFGGGLQPLPNFVRRPRRIAFWAITKLIVNGVRSCQLHGLPP